MMAHGNDADWIIAVLHDLRIVFEDWDMRLASNAIQRAIEAAENEIQVTARFEFTTPPGPTEH